MNDTCDVQANDFRHVGFTNERLMYWSLFSLSYLKKTPVKRGKIKILTMSKKYILLTLLPGIYILVSR